MKPNVLVVLGYTALGGVCLSNSNCRVVDSRCTACDVADETKCVSCITGYTALGGVCLSNSNCRVVDSRCTACDVADETKCVSCITGYTALGGVCLSNSNCRVVDSRCTACDVADETKCVSCITGYTALGGVCLSNSNCRVVDSRCTACDVADETKCVSCITGYTALGGVCLSNSNCRVVDSRCTACDVADETKCVSCITGYTALGGVCLSNSNCRVVDSRCTACDVADETKCVSCITGYTALGGVCLSNSNCRVVDSRCTACDVADETKCVSCITGYTALGGVCLSNSNCRVVDSRCTACDVADETKCVSCITGYTALGGVCLSNSNCRVVDSRCTACDVADETKCVSCQEKYILYKQECILDICPTFGNCLICNYDVKICDKCEDNYFFDFDINKCTKIDCPVNCKTCSQYKCFECENGYETFYENCIDSNCYSQFCSSCTLKLIKGCESCFECDNLKFMDGLILNCEEYVENCNNCHFKLNESLKCLDCKNNFVINEEEHQCIISEQNVFDSFTIIHNDNGFFTKACLNDYYYDIGTDHCYKISFDCEFGCLKCWGDEKNCIECFKIFNKIDNSCLLHNIDLVPNNCEILSDHNLQKFISFRQNNCLKIFNNFTIINEKNVTTYEYNNYRNEKSYEVFSCILNCEIDKNLCMELKGYSLNLNNKQSENCTKIYQELYMIELRNTTNYTITQDINIDIICPKNKNQFKETKFFFSENELKMIINDKLFNFTNSDNCSMIENGNDHLFYDTTSLNDMKEDCYFCQEKNNYFCTWRKECNIECEIEFDSSKNLFINKNLDSIIVFDENLINKAVPLYINVNFEFKQQKLKFNFLKNDNGFTFILKPAYIMKASNCVVRKETEFKITLPKFYSNFKFLDNIKASNSPVNTVIQSAASLSFYFFFPPHLFAILQFNDIFNYFVYLKIDGGRFFDFISNVSRDEKDTDLDIFFQIKGSLIYDYKMVLNQINDLTTISIFDMYLLISIFVIIISKVILIKTIKSRMMRTARGIRRLMPIRMNYHNLSICKKIRYLIEVSWVTFDPVDLINCYEKIIFIQYILKTPHFVMIFLYKYHLLSKKMFFLYYLLLNVYLVFLFNRLKKMYQFLRINSISLFADVIIVPDYQFNWKLCFYEFIDILINLAIVLSICFLSQLLPELAFAIILLLILTKFSLIIHYFDKRIRWFLIFELITILFLFTWVCLIMISKYFFLEFTLYLDIAYVGANFFKLISNIIYGCYLRKIKKAVILAIIRGG